ncbi:DUF3320 domain-containing protein [Chitinophaga pendula]|uniref:DUF3320 domain-containing protein n=1 Tax=Chitinophaga TaxID=79328 RepID=UPI000BB07397|nr:MULTISPECIES: DUF3320 domain-containing protein [Chitinophaga]ASZ10360.1 DNA helicase [Chitinophaga sp. MD30]UCJ06676.1 DUF3320 domain-containing protein [Chitinophaga pendula]
MQETILQKLEASRRELLDLGMRNPLLNYRLPAGRGIRIVQEQSVATYDILVAQGKAMTFSPRPEKMPADVLSETIDNAPDAKLQTTELAAALQLRLLNTYYAARTSVEEQGVNTLYLTLGMLRWYEAANGTEVRQAPLILVPVSLERSSARERFRLRYTGAEVEMNLSLQAKLKADFNLFLPDIPDEEETDIAAYILAVEKVIKGMSGWEVVADAIELGFFSFGKFMLYHDLDSTQWPADSKPIAHPILQDLYTDGFRDAQPSVPEDAFIDAEPRAATLHQVVDADSSQLLAMLAIQEGRNLVIQGPPGTGKSQTITNIIANAIGEGKKVLFVAEKMAALEVVKRRLDNIALGEACLELHSHKANKKELHQALKRVLDLGKPAIQKLQQEVSMLAEYQDELNGYCAAIHTEIGKSGWNAQEVTGRLLQIAAEYPVELPHLVPPGMSMWGAEQMQQASALAERIQAWIAASGQPADNAFWGSRLQVLVPQQQTVVANSLQRANDAVQALQALSATVAAHVATPAPLNRTETVLLSVTMRLASQKPDLSDIHVQHDAWLLQAADIQDLLQVGRQLDAIRKAYEQVLLPIAWQQPVLDIRSQLLAYGDKWYKFVMGTYRRSKQQLAALCKHDLPADTATQLSLVDAILQAQQLTASLQVYDTLAKALFGVRWKQQTSDWAQLEAIHVYLQQVHRAVQQGDCLAILPAYLQRQEPAISAATHHQELEQALQQQAQQLRELLGLIDLDEKVHFTDGPLLLQRPYEEQLLILSVWKQRLPELHQVIAWNNLKEKATALQLDCLIQEAAHWPAAGTQLKAALEQSWYNYLLEQAILSAPAIRSFERSSHEEAIRQFRKLDIIHQRYNRARAALTHWEAIPRLEAGGQVNVLRTEFNKKARHMPIRKLMQEAGLAIQAIKPVFMMSPLSIANYLPPGALEFDLVIFDEASQVKPVDALGAILRGKQLVVVGDSKQLPPTSFFDSLTADLEDEENVTADMQSILGMCEAQGAPQRMLRWHYRSRHESLINLSNQEFYDNKLVIFPSPGGEDRMGLVWHYLPDTVYDKGQTRTNRQEAASIAAKVMEHARIYPHLSLGVVAFSTTQMQAIQEELETLRKASPDQEVFFRQHPEEPFFVKNLENVQGDERAVIFISVGYGKTAEGTVSMSFGPLNNEGGERRLNVLITRAKLRCEVFTNLRPENIDLGRTQSRGVKALKHFLYYAAHGSTMAADSTVEPLVHPFEDHIAALLRERGYTVHTQVGTAGVYIDLAIADPATPGRYLLGITCDGASYQAARSVRDRDRLRQQVLEGMGWKLYRVWSTDWLRHPQRELERLINAIEDAKASVHTVAAANEPVAILEREEKEVLPEATVVMYEQATVPQEIAAVDFHDHPIGRLSGWMEDIVNVESPVHIEEVTRRFGEAAGLQRISSRVKESLKTTMDFAADKGIIKVKGDFLWHKDMQTPLLRNRSELPASSRKLVYIAPEELQLAILQVVTAAIAITAEDAVPLIAKLFGFTRVTEEMKLTILEHLQKAVDQQVVIEDGEWLKITA